MLQLVGELFVVLTPIALELPPEKPVAVTLPGRRKDLDKVKDRATLMSFAGEVGIDGADALDDAMLREKLAATLGLK